MYLTTKNSTETEAGNSSTKPSIVATDAFGEPLTRDEQDLRWYFTFTPRCEVLSSNYGVLEKHWQMGVTHVEGEAFHSLNEEIIDDVARMRRIEKILEASGKEPARILEECLGLDTGTYLMTFGRYAPLVPASRAAVEAHEQSCSRLPFREWLHDRILDARASHKPSALIEGIRAEVLRTYREALMAYREGKRRTGLTGREEPASARAMGGGHV